MSDQVRVITSAGSCQQRRLTAAADRTRVGSEARPVPPKQALYCELELGASVYLFHDGTLVFWQASEAQIERVLYDARTAQTEPYPTAAVETEEMNYVHKEAGSVRRSPCGAAPGSCR